jgi:DNA-binding response OmpR family regulator
MPDTISDLIWTNRPTAERPLLGQTVLVVEDSRFACEALRLLCLRSGARIRRADSLQSAARHLAVYRPSVVIVDLGLPDGCGAGLLRDLARAQPRVHVLLAISGDETRRGEALSAGADDFLPKPLSSLAAFQAAVLAHLPATAHPPGPRALPDGAVRPDPIALRDDLAHAAELLAAAPDDAAIDYAAQFLGGVALSAEDRALAEAAAGLRSSRSSGDGVQSALAALSRLIDARLARAGIV